MIRQRSLSLRDQADKDRAAQAMRIVDTGRTVDIEGEGDEALYEYHMSDGTVWREVRVGFGLILEQVQTNTLSAA